MSLSEQLCKKKNNLKPTDTVVTLANGQRYLEHKGNVSKVFNEISCGFIIDTKPDIIPAQVLPNLYLGSQDCCELNILQEYNIRNVLSIGIEAPTKYSDINYKYVKCLDFPEVDIVTKIKNECLPFLEEILSKGDDENVLVHCNAGVSRSSSVVLAYLILNCDMSYEEAYDLVKTKRQCIRPNEGFEKQLKLLKRKM